MRFAFLIMADHEVDSSVERSSICDGQFSIISVNDLSDAIKVAKELKTKKQMLLIMTITGKNEWNAVRFINHLPKTKS